MFAKRPPAKVVDFLDLPVRAVEEGNFALEGVPCHRVRYLLLVQFVVVLVEGSEVMLKRFGLKHRRLRHRRCGNCATRRNRLGFGSPQEWHAKASGNGDHSYERVQSPVQIAAQRRARLTPGSDPVHRLIMVLQQACHAMRSPAFQHDSCGDAAKFIQSVRGSI